MAGSRVLPAQVIGVSALVLAAAMLVVIGLFVVVPSLGWDAAAARCGRHLTGNGTYSVHWKVLPLPHFDCTYQPEGAVAVTVPLH